MDLEFQFCKMKRVTEIGCAMMSMYLTLQNCTVKNGYNGKFYVMYFSTHTQTQKKRKG